MYSLYLQVCVRLHLQFVLSLIVLIACFLIAFVCLMVIIFYLRRKKSRKSTRWQMNEKKSTAEPSVSSIAEQHPGTSLNAGESLDSSTQSTIDATPLLKEKKSPSYGSLPSESKEANIPDNSQDSIDRKEESMIKKNPLLQKPREASPEPNESGYDFTLDPIQSSGLWEKDKSGQHLMRFIVLILFLLFSSLVVSFVKCQYIKHVSASKYTCIFACKYFMISKYMMDIHIQLK